MVTATQIPLDDVITKIGIGWFHYRLWWICGFGFSAAAVEVVLMSFIFPELRRPPFQLNEYQLGTLATCVSSGSITGALAWGLLADQYGRRNIFMVTVLVVVSFGVLSAFASGWHSLAAFRFFVGFGYGGNVAVDFTLYSEFMPTLGRGRMMFALAIFWPIGQIVATLLAWYLIPSFGWRAFLIACVAPSALTALARPLIPESPRWLLTQGRAQEATEVCRSIAELNRKSAEEVGLGGSTEVCLDNETSPLSQSLERKETNCLDSVKSLFSIFLWRTTLGLLLFGLSLNYVGYGTGTLMPTFFEMKGVPKTDMYQKMLLNAMAEIPGIMIAGSGALYVGRLLSLRSCMFITGLALLGFANVKKHLVLFTMFASCFHEAGWGLFHVYVTEVYPTDVRAFATGFLSAGGNLVSLIAPYISAALLESKVAFPVILTFSTIAMCGAFSAYVLLHIETKDRDLQDHVSSAAKPM